MRTFRFHVPAIIVYCFFSYSTLFAQISPIMRSLPKNTQGNSSPPSSSIQVPTSSQNSTNANKRASNNNTQSSITPQKSFSKFPITENENQLTFHLPRSLNGQTNYVAFADSSHNIWMKIQENQTLRINGKIYANEIRCRTNVWSDFVFHKNYQLPTLAELSAYIKENGHLPSVPTKKEVIANGFSVGEMNAILLQKIEELTLYILQQQEQINELKKRLDN